MKHTDEERTPEAVLRLSVLDIQLVQALARYWLVIVEQQNNEYVLTLYDT